MRCARNGLLSFLAGFLVACASIPSGPYWEDQKWNEDLFNAVSSVLHYPQDVADQTITPQEASVQFTYTNGHLENVELTKSTGSNALDAALVSEVESVKVP